MRTRRRFVVGGGAATLLVAVRAFAQAPVRKPGAIPRIGYLVLQSVSDPPSRERQAFLDGLRELGYTPGKSIEVVYASAEGDEDFLKDACGDLVRKNVQIIVTVGAEASVVATQVTSRIPIVMLAVGDPVGIGLLKSLSRPGGNVTGVSFVSTDLAAKRVQLTKELLPGTRHIGLMWNPRNPNGNNERKAAVEGARILGLSVQDFPVSTDSDFEAALQGLLRRKPDALYVTFEGGRIAARRSDIVQFGLRQRLPVASGWSFMTEAGGLFSYAPDIPTIFRRAAHYVDLVLKGTPPGAIPVEMPTKVEFVINLQTAKAIGLRVPDTMLLRADRLIE